MTEIVFEEQTNLQANRMNGSYGSFWRPDRKFRTAGDGVLFFHAVAANDVTIGLSPQYQANGPMYEIVLGGWGNTSSAIRKKAQGPLL